jgi:hypothetical protein
VRLHSRERAEYDEGREFFVIQQGLAAAVHEILVRITSRRILFEAGNAQVASGELIEQNIGLNLARVLLHKLPG